MGKAFGMKVVAWSPNLTDERAEEAGVERAKTLEVLLKGSDVVSVHIVHSERTTGLLGAEELEWLKPTAFLVNTSRGPIINEKALLDVAGKIGGAGLDVFDQEPLPKEHPLRSASNVILSPHMGKFLSLSPLIETLLTLFSRQATLTTPRTSLGGSKRPRTSSPFWPGSLFESLTLTTRLFKVEKIAGEILQGE